MGLLRRRKGDEETPPPRYEFTGATPLAQITGRERVRVLGEVMRIKTRPAHGIPTLVVRLEDDTGFATITFTGRRSIRGIELGRRLGIEGMARCVSGKIEFTNPAYTLLER